MARLLCTWQQKAVWQYWRNYGSFFKEAKLNEDELMNKFLLAKNKYTYTDWNRAEEKGTLESLETLWI